MSKNIIDQEASTNWALLGVAEFGENEANTTREVCHRILERLVDFSTSNFCSEIYCVV